MASSNQDAIQYVKDAHENLVRWLQNLSLIVEKLHQLDVLNSDDISKIEDESKCNKTRQMLDLILNKGEEACYNFLRILDHERKLVFPKPDVTSLTPDLHIWICLFSFKDEAEEYVQGPISCQELQEHLKTRGKTILDQQWQHNLQFYGEKAQNNFSFIPLVLDTDTEKNTPQNKIILKSKKFKKSRSKKMRAYIPKNTQGKTPEDLLYSKEKSILIVGKPGIGKTAFVQQMLHHWTDVQDSKHDFMFYFDENTMPNTSTELSLENLLLDTFLMTHPWFKVKAEEILQYLQEYSERVLIVFDGIKDFHENEILLETMQHKTLSEAKIVATCRPEVEYKFSYWPACKIYIQGFSEESIYVLLKKMPANNRIIDSIINYPALFSLCHIPMYAFMVAAYISYYTSDEAEKICTASDLYIQIFRHCLQKHGKTNMLHLDGHIKNCRDMVLSLAERAFNATKFKTINLEFDYDERGIAGAFLTIVPVMSPTCAKTFCAFPHNTMQEFFSALWLLEKTEVVDEVLQLCQTEDSKHMKHVIPFLCGLQSQTNIDLLKSLFSSSKVMENINGFFEKVFNTFLCDQPDDENVDIGFICRCLYEFQSSETCCSFLERIEYHLDLSEEHLDPYSCYAVSYVISQSRNQQVHLNLTNSAVPLSGLKTILQHSSHLRDLSATLSQIWTIALKCEELKYLMHLLVLCENKIYIPMSSQTDVLEQAGKMITRNAEPTNLHLHCDKDPEQLTDLFFRTVFSWLPHINSLQFTPTQGETMEKFQRKCRLFKLDLYLQACQREKHIWQTFEKVIPEINEQSDFLLDLYSYMSETDFFSFYQALEEIELKLSYLDIWFIKLSNRKVAALLEVLELQMENKTVKLIDCSDDESVVRSFLTCLPYISQLRIDVFDSDQKETERTKRCRTFLLDLCLQAALHQPQNIQRTVKKVMTNYKEYLHGYTKEGSDFLLDLYSHVQQYESETGRSVLLVLLPVYQSLLNVWSIKLSERNVSVLLEVLKLQTKKKPVKLIGWPYSKSVVRSFLQCLPYISQLYVFDSGLTQQKKKCRTFLLDLCLQAALHQPQDIQNIVKKVTSNRRCHFLLDLYSHVKQYESETGRSVLPALRPVYQSLPDVWFIKLSERNVSVLLEVLKLQTKKKPVKLINCSDDETVVTCFLQCLPYISQLRFYPRYVFIQFLVNLSIAAVHCQSDKGESFTELLASVCSYNTFPFSQEFDELHEEQSNFLLDLYVYVKWYKSRTGRSFLPALLPVYQALPAVWSIKLSESEVFILLEVLKLQTEKKPVNLIDWPNRESKVRCFLQCLPHISQLRCEEKLIPRLSKAVVDCGDDTELVRAFFAAMDFIFTVDWDLSTHNCSALGKVLNLSDSKLKLSLKSRAISLQGARLLFKNITHLQKLCLTDRVVVRMGQALRAVRAGDCLVIEELCLDLTSSNPKMFTFLNGLNLLLNIWTIHSLNLTECRIEAQSFISLLSHPGNFNIRISEATLQQFADLLWEVQDGKLTRCFLKKVGGDLTSCSLSWEKLIYFLQQRVCRISVTMRKSEMTYNQSREFLPLLSEVQFKRLNPSDTLSIIREIYETRSDHCVSRLLSSTHNCLNLNTTELNSYLCSALCFTLQHCTFVSLNLLWTSIPERELVKLLPLFNRVSHLKVDRSLLLKLLHCCCISELQQGAAAVFSALQNRLDFSCSICLDLSSETQDFTLHLTTEECRDISTAIQKTQQLTELILEDCQVEDAGVDMFLLILHTVRLCCSKTLLLRFLALLHVGNESDCMRHAMSLCQALNRQLDLSNTPLDLHACRSLALFLEFSEGLSELDLSHCQLTNYFLELLFPHLHKAAVLDLSHNNIDDGLAERIYTVVSNSSNIQVVRLFNNRITNIKLFQEDKRFEIW